MYAPLGKGLVVLSSFLVFLNGIIHVFHNVLNPWCSGQQTCIGPALRWNTGSTGFTSDSNADGWRTVLTVSSTGRFYGEELETLTRDGKIWAAGMSSSRSNKIPAPLSYLT